MRNVLIVEDNKGQRLPMGAVLDRAKLRAVFATSFESAKDYLAGEEPLIALVTDVHLPDGNGLDLLTDARRHRPDLRMIVVTGDDSDEVAARALELGAHAVLPKPVDYSKLVLALT